MDKPDDELSSERPSERLLAANKLLETATVADAARIREALHAEPVPRIRAVLQAALARIERRVLNTRDSGTESNDAYEALTVLQHIAGLIEHELSAAIGWVEYPASKAVENYDETELRRATEALKRRVAGLVSLARASQAPRRVRVSLSEVVANAVPPGYPSSAGHFEGQSLEDDILTDPDLLSLILFNAMQNAYESSAVGDSTRGPVYVSFGVSDKDFWIAISNPYLGAPFAIEDVQATGVSSKTDHRGLGLRVMLTAAEALRYDLALMGTGQVANFRLRGPRYGDA